MFASGQAQDVIELLREYGTEDWHKEPERVRRAILKLSEGDIDSLRRFLDIAKPDYRDVLWWSERPS